MWGTAPLFLWTNEQYHYYLTDHLGTPQRLVRSNGAITWAARYEAFGKAHISENQVTNPLRFPGQYYDGETGTHYNFHRDYDPGVGRYLQSDPIGLDGGVNTYGYVSSNPYLYIDPYGLLKWDGEYQIRGGSFYIGVSSAKFILTSECDINGKQASVVVKGWSFSVGLSVPMNEISGEVTFQDGNIHVDPYVFEGRMVISSIGAVIGPADISKTNITLGGAGATSVSSSGLDGGISFGITGRSKVINRVVYEQCSCNPGDRPIRHSY